MEVMTTLHESTLSLLRHVKGCVPLEGMIALIRDPFKSSRFLFQSHLDLIGERRSFFRISFLTCGCI